MRRSTLSDNLMYLLLTIFTIYVFSHSFSRLEKKKKLKNKSGGMWDRVGCVEYGDMRSLKHFVLH